MKTIQKKILIGFIFCCFQFGILAQNTKDVKQVNPKDTKTVESKEVKSTDAKETKQVEPAKEESPNFDLSPPKQVEYKEQKNDGKGIKEIQEELAKEDPYKSPLKGKLNNDLIRSMLLLPEHQEAVRKNESLWFGDIFRTGFHLRPRFDYIHNPDFDSRTQDGRNVGTQNSQVWFFADPTKYAAIKFTIQDVRVWGGDQSRRESQLGYLGLSNSAGVELNSAPTPNNSVNIQNRTGLREGFVVLKNFSEGFEIYLGRQVFGFGDNRYVGGRNDGQTGNSFDGARIKYSHKKFSSEVFGSVLAEESNGGLGNNTSNGQRRGSVNDTYLSGIYNSIKLDNFVFDFYWFNIDRKWELPSRPASQQTTNTRDRSRQKDDLNTVGFRITNRTNGINLPKFKNWDYTIESVIQFGSTGQRVNADWDSFQVTYNNQRVYSQRQVYDSRFFLIQTGYTFFDQFRVGFQYSFGSGDDNRSDSRNKTYDASFATRSGGFPYFNSGAGITNSTFWSNTKIHSIHLQYNTEKWGKIIAVYYDTKKSSENDAWYSSGGSPNTGLSYENQTGGAFGGTNSIGQKRGKRLFNEYNLIWQYYLKDYVSFWVGGAYLVAGDAIKGIRENPFAPNPEDRYTFDNKSYSLFAFVQFAM